MQASAWLEFYVCFGVAGAMFVSSLALIRL
jgi:hypothetical protein